MRTGIISGSGRISVAPGPPGAKATGYGRVFSFQAPYLPSGQGESVSALSGTDVDLREDPVPEGETGLKGHRRGKLHLAIEKGPRRRPLRSSESTIGPRLLLVEEDMAIEILSKQFKPTRLTFVEGRDESSKEIWNQFLAAQGKGGGDGRDGARLDESPGRSDEHVRGSRNLVLSDCRVDAFTIADGLQETLDGPSVGLRLDHRVKVESKWLACPPCPSSSLSSAKTISFTSRRASRSPAAARGRQRRSGRVGGTSRAS